MKKTPPAWMMVLLILLTCSGMAGCGEPEGNRERTTSIIGTWKRQQWDLYHTLRFRSDSTAIFDNNIDTLFTYTYGMRGDTLTLMAGRDTHHRSLILQLTEDSLAISGLPNREGPLRYRRVRNEQQP